MMAGVKARPPQPNYQQPQGPPGGMPDEEPPPLADIPVGKRPVKKKLVKRKVTARAKNIKCTNCGAPIEVKNQAMAEMVSCSYCGSVLDLNSEDHKVLRKIMLDNKPPFILELGWKGTLKGVAWEVIGRIKMLQEGIYSWDEYLLYSPSHGYAWLEFEEGHWIFYRKSKNKPNHNPKTLSAGSKFNHQGQTYTVLEKYAGEVTFIEGEFTYQAQVGDRVNLLDAASPPVMMSSEWTDQELEWISGEKVEPDTIKTAFKLEAIPLPQKRGPLDPYELSPERKSMIALAAAIIPLCLVMMVVASAKGKKLQSYVVPDKIFAKGALAKGENFVAGPFKLEGNSLAKIKIEALLDKSWLSVNVELQDNGGKKVMSFTKELANPGSVSGGPVDKTSLMRVRKDGEYKLKITGKGGAGLKGDRPAVRGVKVTVYENAMLVRYFVVLAIVAAAYLLFEAARWFVSDGLGLEEFVDD